MSKLDASIPATSPGKIEPNLISLGIQRNSFVCSMGGIRDPGRLGDVLYINILACPGGMLD